MRSNIHIFNKIDSKFLKSENHLGIKWSRDKLNYELTAASLNKDELPLSVCVLVYLCEG